MLYFAASAEHLIMTTISANLQAVRERIAAAARKCGRQPDEIALLAVGKGLGGWVAEEFGDLMGLQVQALKGVVEAAALDGAPVHDGGGGGAHGAAHVGLLIDFVGAGAPRFYLPLDQQLVSEVQQILAPIHNWFYIEGRPENNDSQPAK